MAESEPIKFEKMKDNRYDLNEEGFEFIVLGTGLTDSIVGGSLAMLNKKSLYLDIGDKYGGTTGNFNLESFLNFIQMKKDSQQIS